MPSSLKEVRGFLISERANSFRSALIDIRMSVDLATTTRVPVDPRRFGEVARVVEETLHRLLEPALDAWVGAPELIGREAPKTLDAFAYRGRAAKLVSLGGLLLVAGVRNPRRFVPDIAQVAFGVDPIHVLLGDFIGDYPFGNTPRELPPDIGRLRDFLDRTCVKGIISAGIEFGQIASQHPRPFAGATISGVVPDRGCVGDEVTIHGAGFGATPGGVIVMFTTRNGGCVSAKVLAWSDSEITVVVPTNVGNGCVGLADSPVGFGTIVEAADSFAGAIETCLGPAASAAGGQIRDSAKQAVGLACPDCKNPASRFSGGAPFVETFTANGKSVTDIVPGDNITVAWTVAGADKVSIQATGGLLPAIPGLTDPHTGSVVINNITLQDGTVALWQLTASNNCGTTTAMVQVVVKGRKGLVLAGGGSKGAFAVGAVRCLRDVAGIHPTIIAGNSVGALNATKLAEGGAALSELEQLWLGLNDYTDLYLKHQWFTRLDPLMQLMFETSGSGLETKAIGVLISFATNKIIGAFIGGTGLGTIYSAYSAMETLDTVVMGLISLVRYYEAMTQAMAANSLFDFTPTTLKIQSNIDPAKVAASGIELRITAVALESGKLRIIDQNGSFLDSGVQVPLRDAVRASASIPIAFPPIPLFSGPNGMENYVDGGGRENVPIQSAVEAGAHRVYAVLLTPTIPDLAGGFQTIFKIAGRAINLVLDEAQRNDIDPFRGFGVPVTIIAPTFLVHDTLAVDPGLISINMDYGYMRAYDEVVVDAGDRIAMRKLSDEIIATRIEAWYEEHAANGELLTGEVVGQVGRPPDPLNLQLTRDLKTTIRTKTYQRITLSASDSVPWDRANWWQKWERHPWQPLGATPWDEMTSRLGTLAAESVPPP